MLVRIVGPSFVAGIVVGERAAPIIGYMKAWKLDAIISYCKRRRWSYQIVVDKQSSYG